MAGEQAHTKGTDPAEKGSGAPALWAGWLAGPIAWALHENVSYAILPWVCQAGDHGVLHLVTLAALALAATGGALAWRSWRRAGPRWPDEAGGPVGRSRFLAAVGLLLSAMSFFGILVEGIPNLVLGACV